MLGFRRTVARGGDVLACDVPDDLWRHGMNGTHLGDQHGEAVSVAKWWSPVVVLSPAIARRSCFGRRWTSGVHGHVDPAIQSRRKDAKKNREGTGEGGG